MNEQMRLVGRERLADGLYFDFERLSYELLDGSRAVRDVIRHPGGVAVLPYADGNVTLVRQHRVAVGRDLLEIPAGKLDRSDEDPAAAAARECAEEVGLLPGRLAPIGTCHTSPGWTDELLYLYVATDLAAVPTRPDGVEEEHAEVVTMALGEALAAIEDGSITDAKTRIALTALALQLR